MHGRVLLCLSIVAASATLVQAAIVSEDVPVPGGIDAAAAALGLGTAPDRARFAAEVTRIAYDTAENRNPNIESWLLAVRANAGGGAAPSSHDLVPVPLSAAVWSDAVFRTRVAPEQVLSAIIADRRASFLCHGLTALDDETLALFAAHPALVRRLYERSASAFAIFSAGLRVRNGRVVVPGADVAGRGPEDLATPLWESAIGESVSRPDRFIAALFEREDGRTAYLYDAIAGLDPPHASFALGLWIHDGTLRRDRFFRLVRSSDASIRDWRLRALPFTRPVYDVASVLDRVRVDSTGAPGAPASRAFWRAVFNAGSPPEPGSPSPVHGAGEPIDAAVLADDAATGSLRERTDRFDQLSFAQRVFASAAPEQMTSVLAAVTAFPQYRTLMLTLERTGVTDPGLYVSAVRAAEHVSGFKGRRGFVALGQFQGALALVTRMCRAGSMDVPHRDAALNALFALPIGADGYNGAMASWIVREFPEGDAGLEEAIIARLAGPALDPRSAIAVEWEGQRYHLDLAAAERRRLAKIREKQGRPTVDVAAALASLSARAASQGADVASIAADLQKLVPELPAHDTADPAFQYDRNGHTPAAIAQRALAELAKNRTSTDRLTAALQPVRELADALMAEALLSFAYAIDLGDPDSAVLLASNPVYRHDFGLRLSDDAERVRTAWAIPRQEVAPDVPWHVAGSALGLDVGLASLALRRIDSEAMGAAPRLSAPERQTFEMTVALMNPHALDDRDRDAIAASIARGRERAAAFAADPASFDAAAGEILLDGGRRRAVKWMIAHEPDRVASMFSLTELMRLGGAVITARTNEWGAAAVPLDGCVCLVMPAPGGWRRLLGRPQLGLLAATVADLNLHVAMILRELKLPAAITRHVLAAAMQDFVDRVAPVSTDDWLTLVRSAQTVSRERIEDYVAAVAADGPLVPDR